MDEVVFSLSVHEAKALTTGEINALFAQNYGASV